MTHTVRSNSYVKSNTRPQSKYGKISIKQRQKDSIKIHVSRHLIKDDKIDNISHTTLLVHKQRPFSSNNYTTKNLDSRP
jgi:hypothetical protein